MRANSAGLSQDSARRNGMVSHDRLVTSPQLSARFNLLGNSQAFRWVLEQIDWFADCDQPVLINGETGTGKELVARAVHYLSARRTGPTLEFPVVDVGQKEQAQIGAGGSQVSGQVERSWPCVFTPSRCWRKVSQGIRYVPLPSREGPMARAAACEPCSADWLSKSPPWSGSRPSSPPPCSGVFCYRPPAWHWLGGGADGAHRS